jgi:hypothetical protein
MVTSELNMGEHREPFHRLYNTIVCRSWRTSAAACDMDHTEPTLREYSGGPSHCFAFAMRQGCYDPLGRVQQLKTLRYGQRGSEWCLLATCRQWRGSLADGHHNARTEASRR